MEGCRHQAAKEELERCQAESAELKHKLTSAEEPLVFPY